MEKECISVMSLEEKALLGFFRKVKNMNVSSVESYFVTQGNQIRTIRFNEKVFSFSLFMIVNNILTFNEIENLLIDSFDNEVPVEELLRKKKIVSPEKLDNLIKSFNMQ